jgi:hypothetical protein
MHTYIHFNHRSRAIYDRCTRIQRHSHTTFRLRRIDDIPARIIEHSRFLVPAHKAWPRFSAEEWGRSGRQAGGRKEICSREDRVGRSTSLGESMVDGIHCWERKGRSYQMNVNEYRKQLFDSEWTMGWIMEVNQKLKDDWMPTILPLQEMPCRLVFPY